MPIPASLLEEVREAWRFPAELAGRGRSLPLPRRWRRGLLRAACLAALGLAALGLPVLGLVAATGSPAIALGGLGALAWAAAALVPLTLLEAWAVARPPRLWIDLPAALAATALAAATAAAAALQAVYTTQLVRTGSLSDALQAAAAAAERGCHDPDAVVLCTLAGLNVGGLLLIRLGRPLSAVVWLNVTFGAAIFSGALLAGVAAAAAALDRRYWPSDGDAGDDAAA